MQHDVAAGEAELFENRRIGLDYRGAAAVTALSVSLLQKLVSRKQIPHRKVGRRVVFIPAELEAWLTSR